MRWRERDTYFARDVSIAFEQISGDFQTFEGAARGARWGAARSSLHRAFDFGILPGSRSSTRWPRATLVDLQHRRVLRRGAEVIDDARCGWGRPGGGRGRRPLAADPPHPGAAARGTGVRRRPPPRPARRRRRGDRRMPRRGGRSP
ncbi:hypothetical protein LV779_24535 [Streptomyces thinghirensis]|nr:hypothetical protein [Streptomyces thinghirensis]